MTLHFDYDTLKSFYDFYKTSDWKSLQSNKIPPIRSDRIVMEFRDQILVENEVRPFYLFISQNLSNPRKFDSSITIVSQTFKICTKTLREIVKWINSIFQQQHCVECKMFAKLDKNKKLCVECYKKTCFKVNTNKVCSICLENIEHNIHRTRCNHYFHFICIMGIDKCPLCRFNFNDAIEFVPEDFQDNVSSSEDDNEYGLREYWESNINDNTY